MLQTAMAQQMEEAKVAFRGQLQNAQVLRVIVLQFLHSVGFQVSFLPEFIPLIRISPPLFNCRLS